MENSHLRIFDPQNRFDSSDPNTHHGSTSTRQDERMVTMRAREIFPALADALATGKTWIHDFEEDEITVPYDLYEVILAYQHYQRISA